MVSRWAGLGLATLLVSACGTWNPTSGRYPVDGLDSLPAAQPDAAMSVAPPAAPAEGVPGEPPLPRRKPRDVAALAPGDLSPDLLVGLDFDATKALLGDPALQLDEPPAKIWAYNGGTCMFNVFFYPSVDDNVFRVLTYQVTEGTSKAAPPKPDPATVKAKDKDSVVVRRCFAYLLHNRSTPDAG